jgi:hypothetical protein
MRDFWRGRRARERIDAVIESGELSSTDDRVVNQVIA